MRTTVDIIPSLRFQHQTSSENVLLNWNLRIIIIILIISLEQALSCPATMLARRYSELMLKDTSAEWMLALNRAPFNGKPQEEHKNL